MEDTFDGAIVISHSTFRIGAQQPKQEQRALGGGSRSMALLL